MLRVVEGTQSRWPIGACLTTGFAVVMLAGAVASGPGATKVAAPLAVGISFLGAFYRSLFTWRRLINLLLGVVLFVPVDAYTLPVHLPFQMEPYRLFVLLLAVAWFSSLLIDPYVSARRSGFELQLLAIVAIALISDVANTPSIGSQGIWSIVVKKLTFLLSFLLVYYILVGLVRTWGMVDALVRVIVSCTAIVGFFSIVEFNTRFNIFDHLSRVLPFLRPQYSGFHSLEVRGGHLRVYASSQHPIALGALFVIVLPLGIYLWKATKQRRWIVAIGLISIGSISTISRTTIVMLLVLAVIYTRIWPREVKRLVPLLVPCIVVMHLLLPGSVGTLKEAFFPKGGIVKEQQGDAGARGSGRIADLGPSLAEWSHHPLAGEGFGTRIIDIGPKENANILDDQWLSSLLETGIAGIAIWIWFFVSFVRKLLRAARADDSPHQWLYAAFGSGIAAFAWGMLFYDAFSFIQVTLMMFIVAALSSVVLQLGGYGTQKRSAVRAEAAFSDSAAL